MVSAGASSEMLDAVPVRQLRGLGGKLGESVVSLTKAETASDLKVNRGPLLDISTEILLLIKSSREHSEFYGKEAGDRGGSLAQPFWYRPRFPLKSNENL